MNSRRARSSSANASARLRSRPRARRVSSAMAAWAAISCNRRSCPGRNQRGRRQCRATKPTSRWPARIGRKTLALTPAMLVPPRAHSGNLASVSGSAV